MFPKMPRLMLLSLLPALVIALFMDPQGFGLLIPIDELALVQDFADVFFLVFSPRLVNKYFYMVPIVLALVIVSMSYTVGIIERHFRSGRLSLRSPLSVINNCFVPILTVILLLLLIYFVFKFLLVCILALLCLILGNFGVGGIITSVTVSIISLLGFYALLIMLRPLIFTAATQLVYGYSFRDAFGTTLRFTEGAKSIELNIALVLPFFSYYIVSAFLFLINASFVVSVIFHTLLTALLMQYVCVFVLVAMFDLSGIERRDVRKIY